MQRPNTVARLGKQAIPLVGTQLCGGPDASPPPPQCQNTMILGKILTGSSSSSSSDHATIGNTRRTAAAVVASDSVAATSFALLAVNVGPKAADVLCNISCLSALLGGDTDSSVKPGDTFTTANVWTGETGMFTGATGWSAQAVPGGPGVVMVMVNKTTSGTSGTSSM